MTNRTYEFTFCFVGHGETLKEAWEAAVEGACLDQIDGEDVEPELTDFTCPHCDEYCLPDANDTEDEDDRRWNCQGCGSSWSLSDEETFQEHDPDGMLLDNPMKWNFGEERAQPDVYGE